MSGAAERTGPPPRRHAPPPRGRPRHPGRTPLLLLGTVWIQTALRGLLRWVRGRR